MILLLLAGVLLQAELAPPAEITAEKPPASYLAYEVQRIGAKIEEMREEPFDRPLDAVRVPDDIRRAAAERTPCASRSRPPPPAT